MTHDDIIRMAQDAGITVPHRINGIVASRAALEAFARIVAAAEREECAEAIEVLRDDHCEITGGECAHEGPGCDFVTAWNDAIRARGDA
jgi:hypothetical protein